MIYPIKLSSSNILLTFIILSGIFAPIFIILFFKEAPSNFIYLTEYCIKMTKESTDSAFFNTNFYTNSSHYVINFAQQSTVINPKKIFLMETSGKPHLNARQACAVESAARQNENMQVIVYFVSPELDLSNKELLTLTDIPNISFRYLNLNQYFYCTPLHSWYFNKKNWIKSPYRISHMSDALRFLTLWKFGGIYLDLDVVVIKALDELRNCAGKESEIVVAPGVMSFEQKHDFLTQCLEEFATTYRGSDWGYNGPRLITRVLKRFCGNITSLEDVSRDNCGGVTALPVNAFYALRWKEWHDFFNVSKTDYLMKLLKKSYLIHVWNMHSINTPVEIGSGQAYDAIAKKYCPSIYSVQENTF